MEGNKIVAALCYFSVLFAPFLFPIIVYFVTKHERVKRHARTSLLSHCIPIALFVFSAIMVIVLGMSENDAFFAWWLFGMIGGGIAHVIVAIWNIIKGIKVLQEPGGNYQ
ncbi:tellurite resistance protein TehA-like permease [Anoxybacillus tepidamans]|uniref:Tellurite resistance protein TehA-like permease n=1 Tax=Anoxybacteroides tepidamans TaxID=265948 RepID=A0A7W8IPK7_9BACL|nr:DUF4870 domain-containing protein [Anoxybacillus tepidamans]MBB5324289.1 tellurite resistance protein TehA-like permease [Anoxybacillus tepidamans]